MIEIEAPDGTVVEFPDGTDDATITSVMARSFGGKADPRDSVLGKIDSAVRGAADVLSFGLADEAAAAGSALLNPVLGSGASGESFSDRYAKNLAAERGTDAADARDRFGYRLGGQLAGGVTGGVGLARNGLSLGARVAEGGGNLYRVAGGSAVDGALQGALQGFGSGEGGVEERGKNALIGGGLGLVVGGAVPAAIAGAGVVAKPVLAPVLARLQPDDYANRAIATNLRRSGMSVDAVVDALEEAALDGQPQYMVADALDLTGRRLLSTVARNPNDARQSVVEALQERQAGQGRRISESLMEAFGARDTATRRATRLTEARDRAADIAYAEARKDATPVDISAAVAGIDDVLQPGAQRVLSPQSNIADDSVEGALRRARNMLTDGRSNLSEFNAVLRSRQDIADMIEVATRQGAGNRARLLTEVRNRLDDALSRASAPYAQARDAFHRASREIDAVEVGKDAAMRGRSEDTIGAFRGMTPGEQRAFRAGYADPLIERTQTAAFGVDKSRPLLNDAQRVEFNAFEMPGAFGRLNRRLAREQRMFETRNAAIGNSKTADNLADAADMAQFDPSVMTALLSGRPVDAAIKAVTKALNESKGMTPGVIERVAAAMTETRPDMARRVLEQAGRRSQKDDAVKAIANAILVNEAAAGTGRLNGSPLRITVTPAGR